MGIRWFNLLDSFFFKGWLYFFKQSFGGRVDRFVDKVCAGNLKDGTQGRKFEPFSSIFVLANYFSHDLLTCVLRSWASRMQMLICEEKPSFLKSHGILDVLLGIEKDIGKKKSNTYSYSLDFAAQKI